MLFPHIALSQLGKSRQAAESHPYWEANTLTELLGEGSLGLERWLPLLTIVETSPDYLSFSKNRQIKLLFTTTHKKSLLQEFGIWLRDVRRATLAWEKLTEHPCMLSFPCSVLPTHPFHWPDRSSPKTERKSSVWYTNTTREAQEW